MKSSQNTSHISPVRSKYEVSFVATDSDLYSDVACAVMFTILSYIWSRYNSTLYVYGCLKYHKVMVLSGCLFVFLI